LKHSAVLIYLFRKKLFFHMFHHSLFLSCRNDVMALNLYQIYFLIGFYVSVLFISDFSYSYVRQTKLASCGQLLGAR